MASGTPAIFGDFGATKELATPGALLLRGTQSRADYSDKGFGDVGDWWEPSGAIADGTEGLGHKLVRRLDFINTDEVFAPFLRHENFVRIKRTPSSASVR
jgi:hypothetical protein